MFERFSGIGYIVAATLRERWMLPEAPPLAPVVAEIRVRCEEAGLRLPSYVAIHNRIPVIFSTKEVAKRRSANPSHWTARAVAPLSECRARLETQQVRAN